MNKTSSDLTAILAYVGPPKVEKHRPVLHLVQSWRVKWCAARQSAAAAAAAAASDVKRNRRHRLRGVHCHWLCEWQLHFVLAMDAATTLTIVLALMMRCCATSSSDSRELQLPATDVPGTTRNWLTVLSGLIINLLLRMQEGCKILRWLCLFVCLSLCFVYMLCSVVAWSLTWLAILFRVVSMF